MTERLRQSAPSAAVPGSLPVLFFGEPARARVATIGLNPSWQEYLAPDRAELEGPARRLETLKSLGASDRQSLTSAQCEVAVRTMRDYFAPSRPVYSWFRPLARVVDGLGASFADGSAVHLNLVQEATDPAWSKLQRGELDALLAVDVEFLRWQIEAYEFRILVCTSTTVLERVLALVNASPPRRGRMKRLSWTATTARANGRDVSVVGWNIPLVRPTGLDVTGQRRLGSVLRNQIADS